MSRELRVSVLQSPEELEALGPEWRQLAGDAAEPMRSHEWQMSAAICLHRNEHLRVLVVFDGDRLAAAAPLVEVRRRGVWWLELLGARLLHEPAALLFDAPDACEALCSALIAQRMPTVLQRLEGSDKSIAAIAARSHRQAIVAIVSGGSCLAVELEGDWQEYARRISAARRNTLGRKARQLAHYGAVAVDVLTPDVHEVSAALRAALQVEASSWKGVGGSAVLQRPEMFEFFVELGQRFASDRQLEIRLLRVGDSIAASQIGIARGDRWWELKIGYDPRWARFSPGQQLAWEGLRIGFERRLKAHEFLGSAASWQTPFANSKREFKTLVVYPMSPVGLFALVADVAGFAASKVVLGAGKALKSVKSLFQAGCMAMRRRAEQWRAAWFDWRYGVETSQQVAVSEMKDISPVAAEHAVHYEATTIAKFERALDVVAPEFRNCTFVDLGSGKGRVVMLAALRPFKRVIGVEISQELHSTAQSNAATFAASNRRARPIECVCSDATTYELPDGDLLLFLYNPFDAELLARARAKMLEAAERQARSILVIYVNPVHFNVFERSGRFECLSRDAAVAVYRLVNAVRNG